jgi:transposase-like protein
MKTCPECKSEDSIEITIDLSADDSVQFFQCRKCEAKWWERDGTTVALDDVLDLTARNESTNK